MATVAELTQRLSAQANAVRTSEGTSRYTGAVAALQGTLDIVSALVRRGKPSEVTPEQWSALREMYERASYTLRAEGVGASAEDWSDIITARIHAARTTPNQTTIGALMEAVDRASRLDMTEVTSVNRDELEDTIAEANNVIRELSQGQTTPVGVTKDPEGNITGTYKNTPLVALKNFLWPVNKPIYLRPGFLLGSAVGVGVLASWQKKNLSKAVKTMKKAKKKAKK